MEAHLPHYRRLREAGAYRSPMLMLGRQEVRLGPQGSDAKTFFGVADYVELDPDGGDLEWDLSADLARAQEMLVFATVMNLGTVEHVWDAHQAWCNALCFVAMDGVFVTVSPVGGWENHGIHITDHGFIRAFIGTNGFEIADWWLTRSSGESIGEVERNNGDQLLWLMAVKRFEVSSFRKPQQVFKDGQPTGIG